MSNLLQIEVTFAGTSKKLQRLPRSFEDLLKQLEVQFKVKNVKVKYIDDESDMITISTDYELQETMDHHSLFKPPVFKIIIEKGENFESLEDSDLEIDDSSVNTVKSLVRTEIEKALGVERSHFPVWNNVRCDGCDEFPITGFRFKCTVCDNFDFCEICEMSQEHHHPFIKLTSKDHNIQLIKVALENPGRNLTRMTVKKPKMKFVQHVNYVEGEKVCPGQVMEKIWRVKNIGNEEWPSECKAGFLKGDLPGNGYEFGPVFPGETVDVIASIEIPMTEGRYTGVWRLFTPDGVSFGDKLYIVVQSFIDEGDINQEHLKNLQGLGFSKVDIISALKSSGNDLEKAVNILFKIEKP
jgi:hypothetical protein